METGANYSHSVEYGYDETGKLLSQIEVINGTTHTTSYEYDDDNRVTAKTTDGITVEYTYDGLGRVTQQVTKNGDTTVKTETYTFNPGSAQVTTYRTQAGSYDVTYTYTYDENGNIVQEMKGPFRTTYEYDSANQIIGEYNDLAEQAWAWSYDNAGNITGMETYDYSHATLGTQLPSGTYTYGDSDWGDLLTKFNNSPISYDMIGNPLTAGNRTYTWEHGRQLQTLSDGAETWTYTYDADGMRTGRTNGSRTYEYIYNGSQLVQLNVDGNTLLFTYDAQGAPETMTFNGTIYYYATNLQGDVMAIVDGTGNTKAFCVYNAYGQRLRLSGTEANILALYNPFWYRGYVYDTETGLYYLQSRYYDPAVGRFINGDCYASTGQGFLGNNMFAYCGNNPVNRVDSTGESFESIIDWIDDLAEGIVQIINNVKTTVTGCATLAALDGPIPILDVLAVGVIVSAISYEAAGTVVSWYSARSKKHTYVSAEVLEIIKQFDGKNYCTASIIDGIVVPGISLTYTEAFAYVSSGGNIVCVNKAAALAIVKFFPSAIHDTRHGPAECGYLNHYHLSTAHTNHIWYYGD